LQVVDSGGGLAETGSIVLRGNLDVDLWHDEKLLEVIKNNPCRLLPTGVLPMYESDAMKGASESVRKA
jgi:hypothetical protein